MDSPGVLVRRAREAAALKPEQLAYLARLDPDRLEDLEHERAEFSWLDLDTCARVFGLRVDDLLAGEAGRAPMTLLLRSDQDESGLAIRDNLTAESCELLGEFQRVLRDIAELERELGRERPALPPIEDPAKPNLHPGERRARAVRMALGLGEEPIASMIELLDKLGISILWSSTAERALDGACARAPIAAVLVVLDEGPPTPWRTRATLAHELCHLLFDLHPERPVLLSPSAVRGPFLSSLERTARAFAASLLAPALGVRRVVGSVDPTSEVAIAIVGSTFGVGRTLAINRLQHTFSLTDDKRLAMEHRMGANEALTYAANFTGDRPPERFGLRGEPLFGLVRQALQHGRIPPSRARRLLGVSPLDQLPFEGLDPELCKPAVSPQDHALRSAFTYLVERHPGFVAREVEPLANGGWRVGVHDDRGERGSLLIGPAGSVEKDDTSGEAGTEG